jgi:hypothetical protein
MPAGYTIVYRAPDHSIGSYDRPFLTAVRAAAQARIILTSLKLAGTADARLFADALASRPIGTVWGHDSGYDFRVLEADFTVDNHVIRPGARLYNYYDAKWGTVLPDQFMAEDLLSPGGQYFDGWYNFAREEDGHVQKFNGERLASREI